MLKGIIFDLDGTITLTEQLHHQAYSQILAEEGIMYMDFKEHIKENAGSGAKNIFSQSFAAAGKPLSDAHLVELVEKKRSLYKKIVQEAGIPLVAGAKEFVEHIHKLGLKKIIATGNNDRSAVEIILQKVGLLEFFPEILLMTEVPRGKPFPDIFLEAANRIGLAKEECVVLEDSGNGVVAAKAAGIRCIAFATTLTPEELLGAGAATVLKDYTELSDEILFA